MPSRRSFLHTALTLACSPFCVAGPAPSAAGGRRPYLQNLRGRGVNILWTSLEKGAGRVEFNASGEPSRAVAATMREFAPSHTGLAFPYYLYKAAIADLDKATFYTYRVSLSGRALFEGAPLEFRTPGARGWRFIAFGDSGWDSPEQAQLAARMSQAAPDVMLHTGDLAYPTGTLETYLARYFESYASLMQRVPFFPCPGNHDYYHDRAAVYVAMHSLPHDDVPEEGHGRYYSFDWGNAHFVSLDSNAPLEEAAAGRGAMLEWLERDLARTQQFWRVAIFHHPPYAGGPNSGDAFSILARERIVPLLEKHGVQLVFNGHEHSYQRTGPVRDGALAAPGRGTIYVTSGGGGADLYPVHPHALVEAGESCYHFVEGRVEGSKIRLRTVRNDGVEIDTAVVAPVPELAAEPILDSASFRPAVAVGGLVSLFGRQLAYEESRASEFPPPVELGGASVRVGGRRVPLLYASPGQINFQLPFDTAETAALRVETGNGSVELELAVAETAPAIFLIGEYPAIFHASGELVSGSAPARAGEKLTVYLTGLGRVDGRRVRAAVRVEIGEVEVVPQSAVLTTGQPGVYQVEFELPAAAVAGSARLAIRAGVGRSQGVGMPVA